MTTLCLVVLGAPLVARAQTPSAEALYDAGALRAAADSFAARAAAEPRVAAHWSSLGPALVRAGADGKAMAAWTRAARLAPRAPLVRRARQFLPPPDAASDPLLATGVATPAEWALAGAAGWVVLWLAVLSRRRGIVVILLGLVTAGCAGLALREWRQRVPPLAGGASAGAAGRGAPDGAPSARSTPQAGPAPLVPSPPGAP